MIRLQRRGRTPRSLSSAKVKALQSQLAAKVEAGERLTSRDFKPYWSESDVREALHAMHRGKCCYCERKRDIRRESDIEHFRPKAGVKERDDHSGYWWLAYNWKNYLFACKCCNQTHKKTRFPVRDETTRAMGPNDSIADECPCLIDPSAEDPEDHISYEWSTAYKVYVKAVGGPNDNNCRGEETIQIVGLNRQELMSERAGILDELEVIAAMMIAGEYHGNPLLISRAKERIREATSSDRKFTAFRRAYFRGNGLGQYLADD